MEWSMHQLNAYEPGSASTVIEASNALSPMEVMEEGSVIVSNAVWANASLPIVFSDSGNAMLLSPESINARSPMVVTL